MRIMSSLIAAALLLVTSAALAIEFKPFPTARVTDGQWKAYYEQVKAAHGASMRDVRDQHLVTFQDNTNLIMYAFTQPGHPAHPAWIARRFVQDAQGARNLEQVGYFAGQEAPFAALFKQYQALNQQMIEEMKRQTAPAGPVIDTATGFALAPVTGYVARLITAGPEQVVIRVNRPQDLDAGCNVKFNPVPFPPGTTQEQVNLSFDSTIGDTLSKLAQLYEVLNVDRFEQGGAHGRAIVADRKASAGAPARAAGFRTLYIVFSTAKGMAVVECVGEKASFNARRPEFEAVARAVTMPRSVLRACAFPAHFAASVRCDSHARLAANNSGRRVMFIRLAVAASLLFGLAGSAAHAQTYPERVIKLILPFTPGSPVDAICRVIMQHLAGAPGADHRGGEPDRRRHHHRRQGGGDGGAGRLHAALHRAEPRLLPGAVSQSRLRSGEEPGPGRDPGHLVARDGDRTVGAGHERRGARGLRQGQSRQAGVRLRPCHHAAHPGRSVPAGDRHRYRERSLSRRRGRARRPARRAHPHQHRAGAAAAAADPRRQDTADRLYRPAPQPRPAGCSHHDGKRPAAGRLRSGRLDGTVRTGRHPVRDRRQAQSRGERSAQVRRDRAGAGAVRLRDEDHDAGGVRGILRRPSCANGPGAHRRRPEAGSRPRRRRQQ